MMVENEESILFVNEFTPGKEHYVQAFRELYWGGGLKTFLMFGATGVILAMILASRLMFGEPLIDGDNMYLYVLLLALAVLECLLCFWLPRYTAKNALRQQQEGYGQPVALKTVFSDNGVSVFNVASKGEMHFTYDVFTRCTETKELLLMKTESKQTLLLLKTGFTQGTEGEFKAFIQKKCAAVFRWKEHV